MAVVGDRVEVPSKRVGQTPRQGIVVGVSGALLRVVWSGGEESTIMPSMGSLVVVGRGKAGARQRPRRATSPAKRSTTRTGSATSARVPATKGAQLPARKSGTPSPQKAVTPPAKKTSKAPTKKAKAATKRTGKASSKKAKSANKKTKPAKKVKRAKGPARAHKRPR